MSRLIKPSRNNKSTELHSLLESDELDVPENGNSIPMSPLKSRSSKNGLTDSHSTNSNNKHVLRAGVSKPINGASPIQNGFETTEENSNLSEIDLNGSRFSPSKPATPSSSRSRARNWLDDENRDGDEDETLFDADWNLSRDRSSRPNQTATTSSSQAKGESADGPVGDWEVAFERVGTGSSDSDSSSASDDDSPSHNRLFRHHRSSEEDASEETDGDHYHLLGSRLPIRRAVLNRKFCLRILSLIYCLFFFVLYIILVRF